MASLLFFAQKAMAQEAVALYGMPVPHPTLAEILSRFLIPPVFLSIVLSGIVSPIIGYRWYVKHGGTKKWLKWLAYLPLFFVIYWIVRLIVGLFLFR